MMKIVGLLALMLLVEAAPKDPVLEDTELISAFLVHRHGDRTPTANSVSFSNNPTKLSELSVPYGYGQLTEVGKQRSYELGKFIRDRYEELLAPQYNRSEVYLRSTDVTRTKMTILAASAAIYPPGQDNWSQTLHWTPVPYTTVPVKYDFNTAFLNCPIFETAYYSLLKAPAASMKKYDGLLADLSNYVGVDLNAHPALVYAVYDLYTSQLSLGLPLEPEVAQRLPEIEEAAGSAINIVFGHKSYIALQAGVLLGEFFNKTDAVIAGKDTQKLRIYSAHDFNVFSFERVTQVSNLQGVPKYASAYSLEVRRVVKTGQYVVLPVYLPEPGEPVKYLDIEGCSNPCSLEDFRQITSTYVLDEDTWRTKCGFTDDIVINESAIN